MSDQIVQSAVEIAPGLTQMQRVINVFAAPSKTFADIKAGHKSWWMPFLITVLCGAFLWTAINSQVTWKTVYENQQKLAPEFAKRMMDQMPPDQRAAADARGPKTQAITWALSPLGLLVYDLLMALILWPTINFGFGGKASYGSILAVIIYAGLVLWPIRLLLGGIALFAGASPDGFNVGNPAPTNIAAFLNQADTNKALYALLTAIDIPTFWCLVVTSIGVAIVAGVKRPSGYIAVFGWWFVATLVIVGIAAI
jgi:ABC-type multidrug transport system fused ATPase/permease subunit